MGEWLDLVLQEFIVLLFNSIHVLDLSVYILIFPFFFFIVKNEMPIVRSVTSYCTQPKQEEQQSESQKNIREEVLVDRKIEREPIPTIAAILGGAGLIPVAAGAYGAYFLSASQASLAIYYQMTYSVGILGFLGAVHWGLAMARYSSVAQALQEEGETKKDPSLILRPSPKQEMTQFTLSVVPMLFSWSLQAMPMDIAMPALLVGFTLQFMGD